MVLRCGRILALIVLTLIAAGGRRARAEVILDESVSGATPDEAMQELSWCATMPGCMALWHEGGPAVVILDYAVPDMGGVQSRQPPSDFDTSPSEPSEVSRDVDDSVPDPGAP